MKVRLLLLLILFIPKINSVPIAINLLSNGKKNLILVSDVHVNSEHLGIALQNGKLGLVQQGLSVVTYNHKLDQKELSEILKQKNASILDNQNIITDSEKALLDKLLEIDNQNRQIDIFWEVGNTDLNNYSHSFEFLGFAAGYLHKNLKNIKINAADNLRNIKFEGKEEKVIHDDGCFTIIRPPLLGDWALSFIKQLNAPVKFRYKIDSKYLAILRKFFGVLEKIRKIVQERTKNINPEYLWVYDDLKNYFEKYVDPYKDLNDEEFINAMKMLYDDKEFKKIFHKVILCGLADAEMLDGMLSSNTKISMLYAGYAHTENIKEFLLNHGFKLLYSKDFCPIKKNCKNICFVFGNLGKLIYYKLLSKFSKNLLYSTYNIYGLNYRSLSPEDFDIIDLAINNQIQ